MVQNAWLLSAMVVYPFLARWIFRGLVKDFRVDDRRDRITVQVLSLFAAVFVALWWPVVAFVALLRRVIFHDDAKETL